MGVRELMQPAIAGMFSTAAHGFAITYNGDPVNAMGSGGDGQDVNVSGHDSKGKSTTLFLRVLKSSVSSPQYDDIAVVDEVQWKMKKIISSAEFSWKLRFERNRRPVL